MRSAVLIVSFAVVVSMTASVAASAVGSPNDFVTVGGQHLAFGTGPEIVFAAVSAHSGPNGEDPHGSMTFAVKGEGNKPTHADVTCLIVSGNDAIATGIVTQPKSSAGQVVVVEAVDNGGPGSSPPDAIRFSFEGAITEVSPGCFIPVLPPVDVQRGNVVVHDAA
jgi:hypothetical protein